MAKNRTEPYLDRVDGASCGDVAVPRSQTTIRIQACRPADRALVSSPAGQELIAAVAHHLMTEETT